ncbi:hypothetical protein B566_EDAN005970 [Ephemera danica]|nr:hypothetical protein B566_EDAN005970 [Ephemera danica]
MPSHFTIRGADFEGATEEDRTTEPQHTAAAGHSNNIVPGVTPAPTAAHQQEMGAPGGDGAEATPSNVPTALGEEGGAVEEGAGGAAVVQPVSRPLRQSRKKRQGSMVSASGSVTIKKHCIRPSIDPTYSGVLTRSMTREREELQTMHLQEKKNLINRDTCTLQA